MSEEITRNMIGEEIKKYKDKYFTDSLQKFVRIAKMMRRYNFRPESSIDVEGKIRFFGIALIGRTLLFKKCDSESLLEYSYDPEYRSIYLLRSDLDVELKNRIFDGELYNKIKQEFYNKLKEINEVMQS